MNAQFSVERDIYWAGALVVLFVLMVVFTYLGGGYKVLERKMAKKPSLRKWQHFGKFLLVIGAVAYMVLVPRYPGSGIPPQIILGWAVICAIPLFRGLYLVSWGVEEIGGGDPNKFKNSISWRLLGCGGILICISLGIAALPWAKVAPSRSIDMHNYIAFKKVPRDHLHFFYLACRDYWHQYGEDKVCNLDKVSQPDIGYVIDGPVEIAGQGTKENFSATARHEDSDTVYSIDTKGNIFKEKKK